MSGNMPEVRKKPEQILQLDPPNELVFRGPFKDVVSTTLTLSNSTEKTVAFKVKTTAPRHYCVKPNSGVVSANDAVKVDVMLQPFEYKPAEHIRHKFMVQTMVINGEAADVESLWKTSDPSAMMDSKLKCVFDVPPDTQKTEEETSTASRPREQTAAPQTAAPSTTSYGTPAAKSPSPIVTTADAPESARKSSGSGQPNQETSHEAPSPSVPSQTSVNQKQIEDQLETIKAENLKLKKELADLKEEGPRQRVIKDQPVATDTSGMNMMQELNASQISPILAAILALIIGYLIGKFIL